MPFRVLTKPGRIAMRALLRTLRERNAVSSWSRDLGVRYAERRIYHGRRL